LRQTNRLLEEYRETVERSRQIIEQSHKLMSKRTGD
jgi:hypothetical protein